MSLVDSMRFVVKPCGCGRAFGIDFGTCPVGLVTSRITGAKDAEDSAETGGRTITETFYQ